MCGYHRLFLGVWEYGILWVIGVLGACTASFDLLHFLAAGLLLKIVQITTIFQLVRGLRRQTDKIDKEKRDIQRKTEIQAH